MTAEISNEELAKRLEIVSGMLTMGEPIAFGADAALMAEAASRLRAGGGATVKPPGLDMIAEAITDYLGERCSTFDPNCACCKTWAAFDAMVADRQQMEVLEDALRQIIDMNVQYAIDRYGSAANAETMSCVKVARAALGGGNG